MNGPDLLVIASLALVLIALLLSWTKKGRPSVDIRAGVSSLLIFLAFFLLMACAILIGGKIRRTFVFGFIAGGIIQPLVADAYLTKRTLVYQKGIVFLARTPVWMIALWTIALTHIAYLGTRMMGYLASFEERNFFLFWLIGSAYFYVFEVIVNNRVHWWKRKECGRSPFNVALYATIAEIITVAWVGAMSTSIALDSFIVVLGGAIVSGILIAIAFILLCFAVYRKQA